jgi:hypothetical protein
MRSTGTLWINSRLPESGAARRAYWFAGWLMAQALPNRAALGVQLSPALFGKLVDGPAFKVRAPEVANSFGCRLRM